MAFTTKLDTNVVTVGVSSNAYVYVAYHTWVKPDGTATEYTALYVTGAVAPLIVTNTYAAIDALINP